MEAVEHADHRRLVGDREARRAVVAHDVAGADDGVQPARHGRVGRHIDHDLERDLHVLGADLDGRHASTTSLAPPSRMTRSLPCPSPSTHRERCVRQTPSTLYLHQFGPWRGTVTGPDGRAPSPGVARVVVAAQHATVRLIGRLAIQLISNAAGLDRCCGDPRWHVAQRRRAARRHRCIYTAVAVVALPMIQKQALRRSEALAGSSALVTSLLALVVTSLLTDGLRIRGFGTWVAATVHRVGRGAGRGRPPALAAGAPPAAPAPHGRALVAGAATMTANRGPRWRSRSR